MAASASPEAQRPDGRKLALAPELAGGVAQKCRSDVLGQDAAPVVGDAKIRDPPVAKLHGHMLRSRVNGVFQQLLDHRAGPFHHLAGGDQVGQLG